MIGNDFGIRREIRKDPETGETTIFLMGLGIRRLYDSQVSVKPFDGEEPKEIGVYLQKHGANVRVLSPHVPLLILESPRTSEGEGTVYHRISSHGADERYDVDGFNSRNLEGMINTMVDRARKLRDDPTYGKTQRHVYPYVIYHPSLDATPVFSELSPLAGRMLSSWEVAPRVLHGIRTASDFYRDNRKCMYCDMVANETLRERDGESRVIYADKSVIAFLAWAPAKTHEFYVIPREHFTEYTQLTPDLLSELMPALFHGLSQTKNDTEERGRRVEAINMAFHSGPHNGTVDSALTGNVPVSDSYHGHFKISTNRIPRHLESYKIPFSGARVTTERPKDTARRIRF